MSGKEDAGRLLFLGGCLFGFYGEHNSKNRKGSFRDVTWRGLVVTWRLIRDWSYLLSFRSGAKFWERDISSALERVYPAGGFLAIFFVVQLPQRAQEFTRLGKTEVTADRDKIEFRLFNSGPISNVTFREELFSLLKQIPTMHSFPGFMALVIWVKFLGEKLKATIPLVMSLL